MAYAVKFAHGKKSSIEKAIQSGKVDEDDIVIFSETDDELGFVDHNKNLKKIKARTNEDIILNDKDIGALVAGTTIPAGTSIDDLLNQIKKWLSENGDSISSNLDKIDTLSNKVEKLSDENYIFEY